MVMSPPPTRFLFLEELDHLGKAEGEDRFHLHHEFFTQLELLFLDSCRGNLNRIMVKEMATELADMIDALSGDRGWRTHLGIWCDEEGQQVASLVRFLRAGGFVVVNLIGKKQTQ